MIAAASSVTPYLSVGESNPIELPFLNERLKTFGPKIAHGDVGTIYEVKASIPPRVYKAIPFKSFKNGDEVRISRIAGEIGIAPTYYNAFVVEQRSKFVVIEMDRIDKTLGGYMEEFAPQLPDEPERRQEQVIDPAVKALLDRYKSEQEYQVLEVIQKPNRVSIEEALERLYEKPEDFYFHLFSRIKELAERCISYGDTHVGNIIPLQNKTIQLIDFDGAKLMQSVDQAKADAINSTYNILHMMKYQKLPSLSQESLNIINWFI